MGLWGPSRLQINLELFPKLVSLAKGQQARYEYEVRYLKAPPVAHDNHMLNTVEDLVMNHKRIALPLFLLVILLLLPRLVAAETVKETVDGIVTRMYATLCPDSTRRARRAGGAEVHHGRGTAGAGEQVLVLRCERAGARFGDAGPAAVVPYWLPRPVFTRRQ